MGAGFPGLSEVEGSRPDVVTVIGCLVMAFALAADAHAQQRPLVTEDPETIGAGRVLVEAGFDYARDALYPVSGLNGNSWLTKNGRGLMPPPL